MMFSKILSGLVTVLFLGVALALLLSVYSAPGFDFRVLAVQSGSMEPAIKTGSVVVVAPQSDYRIGEVITFGEVGKTKMPITHRVHDIKIIDGEPMFITKGDANDTPDKGEIPQGEIKGKVLFSIPFLGYLLNFIKQPAGFMLVIMVPAGLIIFGEAKKIFAEIKKNKKNEKSGGEPPVEDKNKPNNENV